MSKTTLLLRTLLSSALVLFPALLCAADIHLAVASNFSATMNSLAKQFEANSSHRLVLSFGSTGKQYAQIVNGAPFDAFFAADSERPHLLEKEGRTTGQGRFTYARGRLVLWSALPGFVDELGGVLENGDFRHLAIANPRLAPYGAAARQALERLGLWQSLQPRLVRGENIGQTFQFVRSGNAELGFVAKSQLIGADLADSGSYWPVPVFLHDPIDQQVAQLTDSEAVRTFLAFVQSAMGRQIISEHGYDLPDAD